MIELVLSILILAIITVGTLNYQYFGTRMVQYADAEMSAVRTARLILDNWKKTGGNPYFDPVSLNMGFTASTVNNRYLITVNSIPLTVTLAWNDIVTDALAGVGLRQIEVAVQWRLDYQSGEVQDSDPSCVITTYVRRDESGG